MADAAEGTGAPNRSARKACWDARDSFFECVTRTGEDAGACKKQRALFEKDCAASWVDYFIKRRQLQAQQDRMYAQDAGVIANNAASIGGGAPSQQQQQQRRGQ